MWVCFFFFFIVCGFFFGGVRVSGWLRQRNVGFLLFADICVVLVFAYLCCFQYMHYHQSQSNSSKRPFLYSTGVRPYKCDMCEKAFTQRCSLESHRRKIHGCVEELAFNERRVKLYVCEDCGHSTDLAEEHYAHMRHSHSARPGMAVGIDTECRGGGRG